jgi:hypothetical protein
MRQLENGYSVSESDGLDDNDMMSLRSGNSVGGLGSINSPAPEIYD